MWNNRLAMATTSVLLTRSMLYTRSGRACDDTWTVSTRGSQKRNDWSQEPVMRASTRRVHVSETTGGRKPTLFTCIVHGRYRVFMLTQMGDLFGRQIKPRDPSIPLHKVTPKKQRTLVRPYPTLHYTRAWRLQTCTQAPQRGDQISPFARWQRHRRSGLSRRHDMSERGHLWKLTLGIPCPRKRPIADLGLLARNVLGRRCQREVKTARNGLCAGSSDIRSTSYTI